MNIKQHIRCASGLLRDERGIETVEFLAFFPVVLLTVAVLWQFVLIGYTGLVAAGAAREGARAAVTQENVGAAVAWASPGFPDNRRQYTISGACSIYAGTPAAVNVRLQVPHVVFPFLGGLGGYPWVEAKATMRCEPPFDMP
ncbi:MAG: pilus assembly protein TadE [Roseiflexaceae bacterium]|nr:pilus assembly protein TadE [Roseiflexaceae bacterium]